MLRAGDVQRMQRGHGHFKHSEFNYSPIEPVHLLQIWLFPDHKGATQALAERSYSQAQPNQLHLVVPKTGRDNSLPINQDADVFVLKLDKGGVVSHALKPGRRAWVQVAEGAVVLNGHSLKAGDGAALSDEIELNSLPIRRRLWCLT